MSMLSSQIDALRRAAQTYRELGKHEAEQMLLDAADTIWELRDDLQQANAENAKLRELVEDMLDCIEIRAAFGRPPTSEMYEEFARRADELGVEVDDA